MPGDRLTIFIGLLLTACGGLEVAATSAASPSPSSPPTATITQVAPELLQAAAAFRELRAVPGHFSGGTWNDDVDQWMGRKHKAMLTLGELLSGDRISHTALIDLLGEPDETVRPADDPFGLFESEIGRAAGAETGQILVYYWRGQHDFLFFICREETVIGSDWWYAGD